MASRALATLVLLHALVQVHSFGEVLNKAIVVTAPKPECNRFPPNCVAPTAFAKVDAAHVPPDCQCPCPASADPTGGILNPLGVPVSANDDAAFFVDEVLASGFDNPVAVSFADDAPVMFVGERGGRIWYVDLTTGLKNIFVDLSPEVGFSGDRGLMDLKTHPTYSNVKQILVMFTVDGQPNDGVEPDAESPQNQRIIRLQEVGGLSNPNFRLNIIGGGAADGVPICFNTHALGAMQFAIDGSLMVTTGEGAHWNFDMGDWGQDALGRVDPITGNRSESLDAACATMFGAQDVGAWRSQILTSLSGKILRIAPDSGDGICNGSATGGGYPVKNPYCDGSNGTSVQSKIWARGLRNPFRMTRRPFDANRDRLPGVFYFGDVGQGGYEEVNAVARAGMNFGWPCWEGPLPCPIYRDSDYNDDPNHSFTKGCGGSATVVVPCGPITTIARDERGIRLTCPHIYKNYTTDMPFTYWTRFRPSDNAGYFTENAFTGQGYFGATTAGLVFYQGTKYPDKYWGQLFALDFTEKWVKVLYSDGADSYVKTEDFADLIYSEPREGAKVTLESGPDGNICYLTLNGGEVRCFRYVEVNVAPAPVPAVLNSANAANAKIRFSSDGTSDRERDEMTFLWNFGDGQTSTLANPEHTYATPGAYNVSLTCTDKFGNSATALVTAYTNNRAPTVRIVSPVPNLPGNVYVFGATENVTFNAEGEDEVPANLTYEWEYQLVHNSHFHPGVRVVRGKSFSDNNIPDESALERNNLKAIVKVTDQQGATGTAFIRLSRPDWLTAFGNKAPIAEFIYKSVSPARVGQPIQFDARASSDPNLDQISYHWDFGDGYFSDGVVTTHTYDTYSPSGYTVTLNVSDNWGYSGAKSLSIPVYPRQALEPVCNRPSGQVYNTFTVSLTSIEPGAQIYYELFQGDPTGAEVTCNNLYRAPIAVPFLTGVNVTLLVKAAAGANSPSSTGRYTYQMLEPPCDRLGLGTPGTGNTPGSLFCINTEVTPPVASNITVPNKGAGGPYTEDPPADLTKVVSWTATRLNGVFDAQRKVNENTTLANVYADQGRSVGAILKIRVSYDFTGDGSYDRVETFENAGPNDVPGFELFNFPNPLTRFPNPQSITGSRTYLPLVNGTVLVQFWVAIAPNSGTDPLITRAGDGVVNSKGIFEMSFIRLPYANLYQFRSPVSGGTIPGKPTGNNCNFPTVAPPTTGSVTTGAPLGTNSRATNANTNAGTNTVTAPAATTAAAQSGSSWLAFSAATVIATLLFAI